MKVTLYTRRGCHLCDEAKQAIDSARRRSPFDYEELDIDSDPDLRELYNDDVPVVAIDGNPAFKHRLTAEDLLAKVMARS